MLESLFKYASAPTLIWDADFTITRANMAFEKLTGLPSDQIIGNTLTQMFPYEQIEQSLDYISSTYSGNRWKSVEIPISHVDGSVKSVLWDSATIFEVDGITPQATIAQGIDITERKQMEKELADSEMKYRTLFDSTKDAVMLLDGQGFTDCNKATLMIFGDLTKEEFCSLHPVDLSPPQQPCGTDSMTLANQHIAKAMENGSHRFEWLHRRTYSGQEFFADVLLSCMELDGKKVLQSTVRDITERKQAEDALRLAKTSAESANKAKSSFLATMSHEIRTPMNAMMGNLTLLNSTQLKGEQQKCVQDCNSASQILLRVINDILDFSKIEAGKLELVKESYSPMRMLYSLVDMFTARADEKHLRLTTDVSTELPHFIHGARERLTQVISNLLSNAIKFTRQGNVRLSASTRTTEQGILQLVICVRDSGIGIATEKQSVIYESFSQLDNFSTRSNVGTGLGLAISKRLVELMEGEITLTSTPDLGSTFTVTIPITLSGAPANAASKRAIRGTGRKILLADDEPLGREVTTALLERNGHTVTAVADGVSVLKSLQQEQFDILLSDISMPGMDGTRLAQIIRSGKQEGIDVQIPIIALTAHAFDEDRRRFIASGINNYIAKPFVFEELLGLIDATCETSCQ